MDFVCAIKVREEFKGERHNVNCNVKITSWISEQIVEKRPNDVTKLHAYVCYLTGTTVDLNLRG